MSVVVGLDNPVRVHTAPQVSVGLTWALASADDSRAATEGHHAPPRWADLRLRRGLRYVREAGARRGVSAAVLAFYRAMAAKDGWQPDSDRRDEGLCFSKPYGTVTAYLSVWFPSFYDIEGEPRANAMEYGLDVTASHDGSAWC